MKLDFIGWVALVLVIIGALNWGLVGVFSINLVALLFGEATLVSRLIYILVGLAGVWLIFAASREFKRSK